MHLLFTDETNLPTDPGAKFFAYGGLIVPPSKLSHLHEGIAKIRANAGYKPTDQLKFQTSARPAEVSLEACTAAKNAVVELCIQLECQFIAYVILHAIAKKPVDVIVSWGASHVIGKFNYYLSQRAGTGIVVVDRLPQASEYAILSDRFTKGLTFEDSPAVALDRIHLFASSCSNASHASSAVDIVLGCFRYCINQPKNVDAARAMMARLVKLVWCERQGDQLYPMERGLIFRPKEVKVAPYKQEYDDLLAWLNTLLADEQPKASGASESTSTEAQTGTVPQQPAG